MKFPSEFRAARQAAGVSAADVGEMLGVTSAYINMLERGSAKPILRMSLACAYLLENGAFTGANPHWDLPAKVWSNPLSVRWLCDANNITLEELGTLIGVPKRSLSRMLSPKDPQVSRVAAFAIQHRINHGYLKPLCKWERRA